MKLLFENFRKFQMLTEDELLAESRLDDTIKKYPNLEARHIDRLSGYDPSKNNKYLMWMAKQLNDYSESMKATEKPDRGFNELYNHAIEIRDEVEKFHKNIQRIKEKDINSYKEFEDLEKVNKELGFSQRQKRKKERASAMAGSDIVLEDDNFFMVRPSTEEASCYYGRSTKWCISSTESKNYFDQYTGEGKSFYMVLMKNLSEGNPYKKLALVYDSQGDLEEIYDSLDNLIDEGDAEEAVKENLFGAYVADIEAAVAAYAELTTGEPVPEIIKKIATGFKKDLEVDIENVDDVDEVYDEMESAISNAYNNMFSEAAYHAEQNPGGPAEEDFQRVLDGYEFTHADVHFDEYEVGKYYWSGNMYIKLPEGLEWVDTGDGEPAVEDYEDELIEIFRQKADDNYVYMEEVEFDGHDESIRFSFSPDHDEQQGVDQFTTFVERIHDYDDKHDVILEEALEEIIERGYVQSASYRTKLQLFKELPEYKNFDKKLEKGIINIYTNFDLNLPGLIKAFGFYDLKREERPEGRDPTNLSETQQAFLNRQISKLERSFVGAYGTEALRDKFITEMSNIFSKASKVAQRQMQLPLKEEKNWTAPDNLLTFFIINVGLQVQPKSKITGTLLFEIHKSYDEEQMAQILQYVSWLDDYLRDAYDVLARITLKKAQELGEEAKVEEPQLFKRPETETPEQEEAPEPTSENKLGSYKALFESWRKFLQ
jgi:hypothetical protein